ncbi:uncharacterized protein LOC117930230 isoform X4 [Vitis riparia]|uniref:uncharacterized protein LOC117930230 isoform X4 n=1 Tax=Vitis riparia TaxID=96939 RepID=UPI00155A9F46|nr:uncharacterized protein LOC117930230 isoform X4 [Vitis riparia]
MAECVTIIGTIAGKIAGCLFDPIKSELSYMLCYRDHMEDLKKEVQELKQENDDLQITVAAAIRRGDEIRPIVKDWLDRAEKNTGEAETFMQDEKKRTKSCFNGRCPNLKSRYDLGKEAKKKAAVIVEIRKKRIFPHGVSFGVLPGNLTSKNYEAFESRASTLDKVMAALRDDKIKRIGVWGLGGVGKTTLVKQVAKLAEDAKLFDKVVMVAVSREQNLENIQAEIADSLGLNIEEKSKSGRANRLIEILKKKKLLIILDDIWAKLDLEAVGIPCGDDHVGCKIVVTSRRIDVLSQDMGTQPNFEIRILSNDEAWQLFQKTAGGIPEFDVQSVARKVAENCGGLPIALVTVATALKNNKSLPCWDDALRQLTSPVKTDIRGMDEKVYKSLEWSYHSVESEDAKLLFLLCGLMGYGDISLDDLFKCSLGLGLFQGINTLDGSTNRLQALVDRLKSSSLLLDIDRKEYVKMHDVVRDVARQLASKDPRYMVIEATQSGIHESKRCVHLSLSHEGTLDLGEILDRPKIEFFRLVNEGRPLKIPDPLFNGMGKLKVLHLFQMEFSSLPLSLQSLANLRTLCLHCCTLGGVAGIGELKKLEVLSFWGSKIKQLPSEIAQLTCLRWLDLSNCYQLQVIPPNILSNLSQLEHLCMKPYSFTQYMDEEINQERNACLAELKHLSRLTTLNIALQDLKLLPKDMVFDKLTRFKIFIGGGWSWYSPCETKRALKLYKAGGTLHLVDGIGKLLKKTEELSLSKSSGTKSVFHESYKEDFLQLKHLDVRSSPEIQYIVDSKYPRVQEHVLFPLLESLLLRDLINLEKVCHGPIPRGSFGNLKTLEVMNCHGLKIFLSLTMATGFLHLQNIEIGECNVMQQIIAYERESEIIEDGHGGTTLQLFPKLRSLKLYKLPELMNFSSTVETTSSTSLARNARSEGNCDNRMSFFSNQVSFANLEKLILHDLPKLREIWHHQHPPESFYNLQILEVYNCPSLLNLIPSHLIQRFNNLKKMDVNNCEVLKHVFDLQGLDENIRILPRLESLQLNSLPKLRRVVCNEDDDKNDSVRCRFSSSTAFHNLKFLSITNCGNQVEDEGHINTPMEDVVLFDGKVSFPPNLEELVLERLPKLKEMDVGILLKLKILKLEKLPRLRLTIASMFKNFHNLQKLHIIDCGMEDREFSNEKVSFPPNLEELVLKSLPKLMEMDVGNLPNLRILWLEELYGCLLSKVSFLPNLKVLVLKSLPKLIEMDVGNLPNLRILNLEKLHGCLLSKVSLSSNLEEVVLKSLPKLKEIDFGILPKLKILKVGKLPQLVLSSSMFKNFHNLKELCINASTNDKVLFNEKASFLEPRASTLNKIMDALRDHNINLIGVWGMAGVGKTTLLKQVAKQAKQQRLFTRQVHIDLSSIPGSEKLRQRIAKALGIPLWEEVESRRADELKQALKEEKILIILDDIWTEVDLEQVGIPSKDDIWTQCKIVLASRDRDLLCKGMGAQICFPVEYLPLKEAWSLFKKTAGDSMEENLELRPIAIQVVEECEGLPIAIVTIAEALKDETVAVWKNALEQLRSCAPTNIRAVDRKVYSCLEWSYTHLKGDDVKSLFLLCGMLGYGDISLDLLLRYGMGLDLFDRIDSLEQARNRLLELVDFLKASGLLLDSHEDRNKFDEERASSWLFMDADNKFVRMHSVVREVTRAIASKDPHPFVVREDVGLEEWSETDESKRCAFISLHCKAVHELPQGLVCPDLQFFQLHNSNPSLNIPNTFFKGMKKLKILDLPKTHFTTLPSSLDSLTNLQTLHLDGCKLEDIALIGKLTKLEVLSLMGSTIQQLPNEMSRLTNLRLLDLNDCKKLEVIPRNILSSLSQLECLYMKSSFTQWATEGESNACLSELNHLSHLTTLEIHIPDAKLLPKDILFENLTRYGISIGPWWRLRTKRALNLEKVNRSLHLGDGMSKLLERSEELKFMDLSSTKYVLHPSDRESFLELKHLEVGRSPEIQYIMDSKNQQLLQHGAFPFPLLESLILVLLKNLEEVWHSPIPIGFFGNLKTLKVYSCPKLKFLLLLSTARGLSQLEEMIIVNCNAMKQIIAYERESEIKEDGHAGTNLQLFPKLRSLELNYLSQLINFSSELETTSSTSLSTNARSEDSFFSHKVSFPKLEELILRNLPKLKDIWHHQLPFESFSNLQILRVYRCPCLLNLVPAHLIHSFQNLKEINVQYCELLEHVIILQEIDGNVEIFSKLETLKLENLPRLRWIEDGNDRMKHIFSLLTLMNIQNLQELHITNCSMEDLRKM